MLQAVFITLLLPSFSQPLLPTDTLEIFAANLTLPYVVKKSWVENFIKFNLVYEAKSPRPRIVPVGCVPTNRQDGKQLAVGDHVKEHDFVFSCEQDNHGVISYEPIACVDAFGNIMQIGEARRLSNGTVILHCGIFGGIVKKVVEKAAGCLYNNTIYGEDETWIEPLSNRSEPARRPIVLWRPRVKREDKSEEVEPPKVVMRGRLMQCFRPHYNYFESQLVGCVVGKFGIRIGEFSEVEKGVFVKCVEKEGSVAITHVRSEDVNCQMGNETMPEGYHWVDEEKAAEFLCTSGNVVKKGCVLGKEKIPLGKEVRVENGCVFVCHPASNLYMCEKVLPLTEVVEEEKELGIAYGKTPG